MTLPCLFHCLLYVYSFILSYYVCTFTVIYLTFFSWCFFFFFVSLCCVDQQGGLFSYNLAVCSRVSQINFIVFIFMKGFSLLSPRLSNDRGHSTAGRRPCSHSMEACKTRTSSKIIGFGQSKLCWVMFEKTFLLNKRSPHNSKY